MCAPTARRGGYHGVALAGAFEGGQLERMRDHFLRLPGPSEELEAPRAESMPTWLLR